MTVLVHIILMLGYIIIALIAAIAIPGVFSEISILGARVIKKINKLKNREKL